MNMITIFEQTIETDQIPVATRVYKEDDIDENTGVAYTTPYNVRAEIDFLNTKAAKLAAVYQNEKVLSAFIQKIGNAGVIASEMYNKSIAQSATQPETPAE